MVQVTACTPVPIPAGTVAFTWYKSANCGARPLNDTLAVCPPIVIVGVAMVVDVASVAGQPSAGWLLTGPRPLRYRATVVPRATGLPAVTGLRLESSAAANSCPFD